MKIEPHYPHSSCKKIVSFLVGFMINQVLGFWVLDFWLIHVATKFMNLSVGFMIDQVLGFGVLDFWLIHVATKFMSLLVGFMINQVLGFGGLGFLAHSSCNNIYELVGKVYGLTKF